VRYAVDGYGVFSCVIGGMIERMRSAEVRSVVMLAVYPLQSRRALVRDIGDYLRMTEFSALALIEPLQRGLKEVGYGQMTPVQASSLPAILAGRDVVAQARTGSGKTAAFALGLLSALDATSGKLHGLVLVPTRNWLTRSAARFADSRGSFRT